MIKNLRLIEYKKEFGNICCPKGFLDELRNLDIEDQVKRYRWISYKEVSIEEYPAYIEQLKDHVTIPGEETLIVKDGVVVGFYRYASEQYPSAYYVLPYQSITYHNVDNNGAGYKESSVNQMLICWQMYLKFDSKEKKVKLKKYE